MISLISEGLVRRVSRGIHGPESNQKAFKLRCFREGWILEVRGKRKLLDDSRSPKVVKRVAKYTVFVIFMIREGFVRRVEEFVGPESNQKAFKLCVSVKVGSSKSVKIVSC